MPASFLTFWAASLARSSTNRNGNSDHSLLTVYTQAYRSLWPGCSHVDSPCRQARADHCISLLRPAVTMEPGPLADQELLATPFSEVQTANRLAEKGHVPPWYFPGAAVEDASDGTTGRSWRRATPVPDQAEACVAPVEMDRSGFLAVAAGAREVSRRVKNNRRFLPRRLQAGTPPARWRCAGGGSARR